MHYRTGAFARAAGVTVRTVRYYDQIGLLRPAIVDAASGYRGYQAEQLAELRRIIDLKALDFSLDEIGAAVRGELAGADLRALLEVKRRSAQRALLEARSRLDRIESALAEGVAVGPSPAGTRGHAV